MKVYILEQRLLDYRIPIYDLLNQIENLSVEIIYWEDYKETDFLKQLKPKEIGFQVNGIKILSFLNKLFIPLYPKKIFQIKEPDCLIVRGNIRNVSILPLLIYRKILGMKTIIWGQGGSRKRDFKPFKNIFDFISYLIMKLSDAYIVYDDLTKANLETYFKNKIFVARNTIDFQKEAKYYESISLEKDNKNLKFNAKINLCFVGRLSYRKKIPRLLQLFDLVLDIEPNSRLWIVGDGPESLFIKEKASMNQKIIYLGPLYEAGVSEILYYCDAILMPGWMGLAVNHSMYYGTPIFSELQNNSLLNHAPEGSYVQHNYNGFLSKENDDEEFKENFKTFLEDKNKYALNCRQYALNYLDPKFMISGIIDALNHIKN